MSEGDTIHKVVAALAPALRREPRQRKSYARHVSLRVAPVGVPSRLTRVSACSAHDLAVPDSVGGTPRLGKTRPLR